MNFWLNCVLGLLGFNREMDFWLWLQLVLELGGTQTQSATTCSSDERERERVKRVIWIFVEFEK